MRKIKLYSFLVLIAAIVAGCANSISPPSGGPKDVDPPKVLNTTPPNGSPNFKGYKFEVEFDEFISLDNINQAALISPPTDELPDFRLKGKNLVVRFKEDLKDSTTYSVYFGNAIVDITEKNPVKNYNYIFSTGDYVDSLSFVGRVFNAFDLTPVEEAFVMLYKDNNDTIVFDSLPYYVPPYYLTRTDEYGNFRFNGLDGNKYLLFALNDQNNSLFFDMPNEEIAFLDSLITPYYIGKPVRDSVRIDSLISVELLPDTIVTVADSLLPDSLFAKPQSSAELYLFLTPDTTQALDKAEVQAKNRIVFSFTQPADNVVFEPVVYPFDSSMYITETNKTRDTVIWHLNNPPTDSLQLVLTCFSDTLREVYLKLDPSKKSARVRKRDTVEPREYLRYTPNINGNILDLNKMPKLVFSQPMVKYENPDSALLVVGNDSIWKPEFEFIDSLRKTIVIPVDMMEETKYRIYFPDSSFSNWNNIYTDEIDIRFKTPSLREYGSLTFELLPEKKQDYVFQLMTEKEAVISEYSFSNDTVITMDYMKPETYRFKIIFDNNGNGEWDSGNFGERLQPEKVIYYPKSVKVRANWEIEEEWKF